MTLLIFAILLLYLIGNLVRSPRDQFRMPENPNQHPYRYHPHYHRMEELNYYNQRHQRILTVTDLIKGILFLAILAATLYPIFLDNFGSK